MTDWCYPYETFVTSRNLAGLPIRFAGAALRRHPGMTETGCCLDLLLTVPDPNREPQTMSGEAVKAEWLKRWCAMGTTGSNDTFVLLSGRR